MRIAIFMVLTALTLSSCYGVYGGRGRRANPSADCPRSDNLANPVDASSINFVTPA